MAAAERGLETPAHVERALLAAFQAEHRRSWVRPWMAAAASVLVVIALSWMIARSGPPPAPAPAPQASSGFIAIPFASGEPPVGGGYVVRVRLERTALVSLGLPAAAGPGGDSVQADLLVGDDGVAHAIRFVR
ncbi:MAG TPA: hypothetical protein DEH78_05850 [Solibacterales bacterium]|nr:hypothetical protein [Bryobacterales bacterium]